MNQLHQIHPTIKFGFVVVLAFCCEAAMSVADNQQTQPSRERFVPVDQLDAILKQTPSGVLLPKAEFQDLLLKAKQAVGDASPGAAVITSATYKLSAEQHRAVIELTLQFRQFLDGWTTLTIPIGNLQTESATLDGNTANVGTKNSQPGQLIVLNDKAGTFKLQVTLSTPLLKSGSDRTVVFKSLERTNATLDVVCPAGEHVILNSRKLRRAEQLEKATTYSVPIGHTRSDVGAVRVTWTTRRQQEMSDNLVFATSSIEASLNTSGLKWNCESRLSVFGEKIDQLTASVPATLEITSVDSIGLEQWTLEDDPESKDRIRLLLKYRQPFSEDRLIRIAAVSTMTLADTKETKKNHTKIPTLIWNQLTAHTGQIAVQTESTQRLFTEPVSGLDRIANPQRVSTDLVLQADVFHFWKQQFDLHVGVHSRDRELFSKIDSVLSAANTSLSFRSEVTIETLNEPLFDLLVEVPENWQIQSLNDDSSIQLLWSRTADGKAILVDLPKPVEAGELLTLQFSASRTIEDPAVSQTLPLPVVRIKDANQAAATYAVSCASDLKLSFPELAGLVPIADSNNRLVFEAQTSTYGGTIQIDRQIARLATRAELRSWMEPDSVSTTIDLTVDVVNGSTRTLTVALPESLTAQVRFQLRAIGKVPGQNQDNVPSQLQIIEQTALPVEDGVRRFRLTFDKRFIGSVNLFAAMEVDREADFEWSAPFVRITEASRQQGFLVFEARPEQQLAVVDQAATKGVTTADASMVSTCDFRSGRRVAMVFRCVKADYSLTVKETTFETQAVPSAVCQSIHNVVVYDTQAAVQRSAKINVQTSGVQTLRFKLPENSYLWSTVLNGKAVKVRRDAADYLVALPLPSKGSTNQSHQLEILFQSPASQSKSKQLVQDSVDLLIDTNEGPSLNVEILEQSWKLSYPKIVSLTEVPVGFQLESGTPSQGWIRSIVKQLRAYRLPPSGKMIARAVPTALALLALFVATFLVIRRRRKTVLGLGLAAAIVGLLSLSSSLTSKILTTETAYNDLQMATDAPSSDRGDQQDTVGQDMVGQQVQPRDKSITFGKQPASQFEGGGFGGGGFGGGLGGGSGRGGTTGNEQLELPSGRSGDSVPGVARGVDFGNVAQQLADDPFSGSIPDPRTDSTEELVETVARGRNTAVLSVKANVANPDHFHSAQFRSINSNATDQSFPVKLQSAQTRQALLIIAAAVVALLFLFFSKATIATRLTIVCLLAFVITALVPLLDAAWQPLADGMLLGTGIGILIWMSLSFARFCSSCCRPKTLVQLGDRDRHGSKSASAAVILLLCLFTEMQSANAQQSPLIQQTETTPNQAATVDPAIGDSSDLKNTLQPDVVLPYELGQPELLANKVFLPKEQFLKLYRLANPDQQFDEGKESAARVVAAFYKSVEVRQTDSKQWVQQFEARFVISAMSDRPEMVTLPITNISLISATILPDAAKQPDAALEDRPALVAPTAEGGFQVKVQNAGLSIVDLAFRIKVKKEQATGEFKLDLLPVATGTIEYELPADELKVTVNNKLNGLRQIGRKLLVPISEGGSYQIRWTPEGSLEARDTFFHVDSKTAVRVTDKGLSTISNFNIAVRQGAINRITLKLPDTDSILAVEGPNMAGWQTVNNNGTNELTIDFLQPVSTETFVTVNRFRKAVIDTVPVDFQVPLASVVAATRDSGTIAVLVENGFDVRVNSLSSVSQIDTQSVQLPSPTKSKLERVVAAFRYTRQPAVVALKIGRDAVRQTVDFVSAVQVDLQRQRWTSLVRTTTTGTAVRRLQIALPPEFLVLDVQANDIADWYIDEGLHDAGLHDAGLNDAGLNDAGSNDAGSNDAQDGSQQRLLTIQLSKARSGIVNAVIQGQTARSGDGAQETLIGPTLPAGIAAEVDHYSGQLHVWLDDASEISSIQAQRWKRVAAGTSAPAKVRALNPAAPAVSFTSTNPLAAEIKLNLRKAAPSLLAESVLVTNVTDTSLEFSLALNWQISRAAGTDFSFTIPSALSDAFDFRIPGLRQLDQQVDGEQTKYTIRLQQPVTNKLFVMGTATLPLPAQNQIQPFDVRFAVADSSQAMISGQSHYWVLVNQSAGLLQLADIQSQPLEVESSELKTKIPTGFLQQSVSIQRCKSNQETPAWKLSFPEPEQVTAAVVSLAAHRLIIAEDGSWKSHHTLQVRNEGRQFLPIVLPEKSRFLSCLVKGHPSRIVLQEADDQERSLIPIPQSGRLATVFQVEFLLAGQLSVKPTNLAGQSINLPLPEFPEFRDDPLYGISVARNTLKVFTPAAWHTSTVDDPQMTNVVRAQKEDLEDAKLLSAVDNLRNLIDSAKSSNSNVTDQQLQVQFFNQKQVLDSLAGNSKDASTERNRLLSEFDDFTTSNGLVLPNTSGINEPFPSFDDMGVQVGPAVLGNSVLQTIELNQNRFTLDNNTALYSTNGGSGLDQRGQSKPSQANLRFNFVLPEVPTEEPISKERLESKKKTKGSSGKSSQSFGGGKISSKSSQNRSQLMMRSQLQKTEQTQGIFEDSKPSFVLPPIPPLDSSQSQPNVQVQDNTIGDPEQSDSEFFQRDNRDGAPFRRNGSPAIDRPFGGSISDQISQVQNADSRDNFQMGLGLQNAPLPTSLPIGLLSLDFELPESGNESNFIRTGGNPRLTLKVRSTKHVERSYAWIWAASCLLLFIVIRRSLIKPPEWIAERVVWLSLVLAVAGWIFLPEIASIACLIVTVILAVAISAMTIYRSFIDPQVA